MDTSSRLNQLLYRRRAVMATVLRMKNHSVNDF